MVINQLISVGANFDDKVMVVLIFFSFTERWIGFIMDVSNFVSSSNTLKFDDVVGVIVSEEMQRKITGETLGNALTMESRRRQRERGRSLSNHNKYRNGISMSKLGNIECWNYGKR